MVAPPVMAIIVPRPIIAIPRIIAVTPIAATVGSFFDKRVAGFRARLKSGDIAADGGGFSTGRGEAETQCEGDSQK